MELSVVVPVRNEAENIRPLIEEIRAALEGVADYEILYVDDGSDDDTPQRLREMQAEAPQLRVVRHRASCGQSTAVRSGVKQARGRWIATLDGDGQNDPADIPRLLEMVRNEPPGEPLQMVAGWRRKRHDTPIRRLSSKIANGVRGGLLHDDTPDTGCGLKLFLRETFLDLPYFSHMHRFLPALVQRAGGRVVSVEVNHRPRTRGVSKYGIGNRLWVGIVDLFGVRWLQKRARVPQIVAADSDLEGGPEAR
ncbi:glycosyltransferase family 2 protein [Endothiovibrio diazotrophicus]